MFNISQSTVQWKECGTIHPPRHGCQPKLEIHSLGLLFSRALCKFGLDGNNQKPFRGLSMEIGENGEIMRMK